MIQQIFSGYFLKHILIFPSFVFKSFLAAHIQSKEKIVEIEITHNSSNLQKRKTKKNICILIHLLLKCFRCTSNIYVILTDT